METTEVNNQKHLPVYMASCLWILTNVIFGFGFGVYSVIMHNTEYACKCFPLMLVTSIATIPVLLVLTFTFSLIDDLPLGASDKLKRLLLTCYGCTLPYAMMGANIFINSYNNLHFWRQYWVQVLYQSAVLFACSLAGILILGKTILKFFSVENEIPARQNN